MILSLTFSGPVLAAPGDLGRFLKACAWGTAIGAGAGAVTLAFEEKPSDHTVNVARGASLGLYAGIAYGLLQQQKTESRSDEVIFLPYAIPGEDSGLLTRFEF